MVSTVTALPEDVIDVKQAARFIRMSVSWTYRAAERGDVPSHKQGSRRMFRVSTLQRWLDERERKEASR